MKLFNLLLALVLCLNLAPMLALLKVSVDHPPVEVCAPSSGEVTIAPPCGKPVARTPQGTALAAFAPTAPHPETGQPSMTAGTFLALHMAFVFCVIAWRLGRGLARLDQPAPVQGAAPLPHAGGVLEQLQEGTRGAGDFVIVAHVAEDLDVGSTAELRAALEEARRQDPSLELREVAGELILRRPRI